jgi:O-antigen ligase
MALYQYFYQEGLMKWISLGICGILSFGVIISISRGALVSFILIIGVIMFFEHRKAGAMMLIAVLMVIAIPFTPSYFWVRTGDLWMDLQQTIGIVPPTTTGNIRGYYNRGGLRIWQANPVFGVGMGNFGTTMRQRDFNAEVNVESNVATHNIYMQALAESGTLGFGALIALIIICMRNVLIACRLNKNRPDRRSYYAGLGVLTLTIMIAYSSVGNLMSEMLWLTFTVAALSRRVALADQKQPQKRPRPQNALAGTQAPKPG